MAIDQVLRIAEFDARIEEALRDEAPIVTQDSPVRFAPPAARTVLPPLPNYVQHREDVDVIGKAASAAIVEQYDGAMRSLEAMGKQLIDYVKQSQEMAERALDAVKFVQSTCDEYREESKLIFARIQHASALTAEVRKVCEEMRSKIHENAERQHPGHPNSEADAKLANIQAGLSDALVRGDAAGR